MAYEIRATPEFREWMQALSPEERESFDIAVNLLKEKDPVLARPYVDTVKGSAFSNMKELRTAHDKHLALRGFFVFDPKRAAILLEQILYWCRLGPRCVRRFFPRKTALVRSIRLKVIRDLL